MILYCIVHGGNILRAFVHKFRFHPDEEAVFIVDKPTDTLYCPPVDKIKYYQMPDPFGIVDDERPLDEIREKTDKAISDFFRETDIDPLQFSHIYSMFDVYNPFILYFELHSVKYMLIELFPGQLNMYAENASIMNTFYIEIVRDMHLNDACGKNCIKGVLFSEDAPCDAIKGKVALEHYDYYDTLVGLSEEHKRQLIEGYRLEQYDFNAVMLFSSQIYSMQMVESHGSALPCIEADTNPDAAFYSFYKALFDYYFSDLDFVVKLHPNSDESFVKAFSDFKQLPREIPMEAFILLDKKFDIFCPAVSGSIFMYQQRNYNVVFFDTTIYVFMRQIHFVFLAFTLINAICKPLEIYTHGIEPRQLYYFTDWVFTDNKGVEFKRLKDENIKDAVFVLAENPTDDFMEMIKRAPEECLIFLNGSRSVDERIFAKQEMFYSFIDVSGEKEVERQKRCWTVLSKSRGLVEAVKDFSASYVLEKAKMKIESKPR